MDTTEKDGSTNDKGTQPTEAPKADVPSGGTFTQADVDRRVTEALKKAEAAKAEALSAERERLEAERLAEQGEFKKLHEKAQAELEATRSALKIKEHNEAVQAAIREAGLTDFEAVLTGKRETPDDYVAAGKSIADLVKAKVDAEVAKRLETGTKPTTTTSGAPQRGLFVYPSMVK